MAQKIVEIADLEKQVEKMMSWLLMHLVHVSGYVCTMKGCI